MCMYVVCMRPTTTGLAGLALGLTLGLSTSSIASTSVPTFQQNPRECASATDTICTTYAPAKHGGRVARTYRFVEGNRFCVTVLYGRRAVGGGTRCEQYWPFASPIINPQLAPTPQP